LLTLLVTHQTATPAWAWGRLGHRVIARLAEKHMTPEAKAAVAAPLEPGESMAGASLRADEIRGRMRKTAPWHYVNVSLNQARYNRKWSADDPQHGFIVDKINEFRLVVKDKSKSIEERRFALRFLLDCIEDLHQPLHVGDNGDRGGNDTQVRFFTRGSNMHRVWDSGIIERAGRVEDRWLADLAALDTPEARAKALTGAIEDWASESSLAARGAYQDPATGKRIRPGARLADAYQEVNLPVAWPRFYRVGVRLAWALNGTLGPLLHRCGEFPYGAVVPVRPP
jgi:hypothetical protein